MAVEHAVGFDHDGPRVLPPAFVGRARELSVLRRAMAAPSAVVLVEGEAGIGKSRLLRECFAPGSMEPRKILFAFCPPFRESVTMSPVVSAVRQALGGVAGVGLSPLAGALRPLFPEWVADLPPMPEPLEDPRASLHRLFRALAELLDLAGVAVLVVEDVHWADDASLEFLLFLTTSRPGLIHVVVSYRPEDVPPGTLLRRLSFRLPSGMEQVRVRLGPLDPDATAELASSMLGGAPISAELEAFLHGSTDGIPLAVEESVRLLRDRDGIVVHDGQWRRRGREQLQVPPTVRDLVLERGQRLGHAAQRVLEAAAVLGEPADEDIVAAVTGLDADTARAGLVEALECGLLGQDERGRVAFRHVLARAAIYDAIPGPRRRQWHVRIAALLERVGSAPVVTLARHFREGHDAARWCHYAERAADSAVASDDHTTAAILLNDLLSTVEPPATDYGRLAGKLALSATSRRIAADDLVHRVIATLRAVLVRDGIPLDERAEVRHQLGWLLTHVGDYQAGRAEIEAAVPHLRPVAAAKAMMRLARPHGSIAPVATHLMWLRRALDLAGRPISPADPDRVWLAAGELSVLLGLGQEEGWVAAARFPVTSALSAQRHYIALGNLNIGHYATQWGRFDRADAHLGIARGLAEADQYLGILDMVRVTQARLDWLTGRWDGLTDRCAELMARDDIDRETYLEAAMVTSLVGSARDAARGVRRQAEEQLRRVLDYAVQRGIVELMGEPAGAVARQRLADGGVEDALHVTDAPFEFLVRNGFWHALTDIAPVRVDALVRAGREGEAERIVSAFARGLTGRTVPGARAALATCRAILVQARGDLARAGAAFERAARAWARLPRPYESLLARERRARCLIATGDSAGVATGVAVLTEVFAGLSGMGADSAARRVARALRGHGMRVGRSSAGRRSYGDQLSPAELDVVRLVVAGRTNREIAQALSKSPWTVGRQVNSAMRKLRVSSRTALAVAVSVGDLLGAD